MIYEEKTGGPAFPLAIEFADKSATIMPGMTLRDYFAAQALTGFMANKSTPTRFHPEEDAAYFYALADAMLKERTK